MWANELYRHIAQMVLPCLIIMVRSWVLDPLQCVQLTNNLYFKKNSVEMWGYFGFLNFLNYQMEGIKEMVILA